MASDRIFLIIKVYDKDKEIKTLLGVAWIHAKNPKGEAIKHFVQVGPILLEAGYRVLYENMWPLSNKNKGQPKHDPARPLWCEMWWADDEDGKEILGVKTPKYSLLTIDEAFAENETHYLASLPYRPAYNG